jgi:hypothetical protein
MLRWAQLSAGMGSGHDNQLGWGGQACEEDGMGKNHEEVCNSILWPSKKNRDLVLSLDSNYQYMCIQTKILELQYISISWLI